MGLRWAATVVGGLIYLFFISWKLSLVMLSVVPIVAFSGTTHFAPAKHMRRTACSRAICFVAGWFAGRWYGDKMRINSKATQQALADATTVAEESISNIRTVRAFYREPFQQQLYDEQVDETYRLGAYQALLYGAFIGGITFVASAALVCDCLQQSIPPVF
jgi:ABC-type multidrug transport system fused ATPase/permease subunit